MKLKKIVALALSICVLFTTTAFATANSEVQDGKPTVLEAGKTAVVQKGGQCSITLEENASTGYSWSYTADESALKLVSENSETANKDPMIVGAPSLKTWVFAADKAGTYSLTFAYARSWEKGVAPVKTAEYKVIVEEKSDPVLLVAGKRNTVKKDGLFTVSMDQNPSTGYYWKVVDNKRVQLVEEKTIEPTSSDAATSTMVGAPVQKVWTFKALKKGNTTLKFGYANPAGVIEKTVRFSIKIK